MAEQKGRKIRAILTGATGMVGEGVLHECLEHPDVETVLVIGRKDCGVEHPKMRQILHSDFLDIRPLEPQLSGYNACYFCLGVSSVGMKEPEYTRMTYDLTLHVAEVLSSVNPGMTFCYVSGSGTDSSENGRFMWARVKGKTENDLFKLPFHQVFAFRPGYMHPTRGMKNTLKGYRYITWLYPLMRRLFPQRIMTLAELGLAMIFVGGHDYGKKILESRDIIGLAHQEKNLPGLPADCSDMDAGRSRLKKLLVIIKVAIRWFSPPNFLCCARSLNDAAMIIIRSIFLTMGSFAACFANVCGQFRPGASIYTQKIEDTAGVYFTESNFNIRSDGRTDVTDALQSAIYQLKRAKNFGILFIPEGSYAISRTIYVPPAIRLIGYGRSRPLILLKKNSPGFQQENPKDKGNASYMFWFTSNIVDSSGTVHDAGAGTFYSALSNIDLKIEDGNPAAVALSTHFAQHSFISHCNIEIGKGKAGLFDVGNMIEDVQFLGGEYGIYTTKASPGWPIMMMDTYFEGQRKMAIKTQEAGFTIVRMQVTHCPSVLQVDSNYWEKIVMQDCRFENILGAAIRLSDEGNANTQLNIRNLVCQNVPILLSYPKSDSFTKAPSKIYAVTRLVYGLQMEDLGREAEYKAIIESSPLQKMPGAVASDIPGLPPMSEWANLKSAGAVGDGLTDDTRAIQKAIDEHDVIYVPEGSYRISETLKLKTNTVLIGLHPMGTNFVLAEDAAAFGGFGAPKAMMEAPTGGTNIFTGIGLYTARNNFRAVACKWMAGERSMMDDVKFIGGHGTMRPGPKLGWKWEERQSSERNPNDRPDQGWDTQYWSLWVTHGGGGIFKNIWSANTWASSGFYADGTATRGRIYAMSVEHHVRNEVRFNQVSNWEVYALQLEEESQESSECQPLELQACSDMTLANIYLFRVIRMKVPYPYSIRTWECRNLALLNIHNYSQIKYTTDNPLYDIHTGIEVRPTELARLIIRGTVLQLAASNRPGTVEQLAKGFEFAIGLCHDSKGNVYFAEQRKKRIYQWSAAEQSLQLVADFPWEPLSLGCDSQDNLLVVFRYNPQPGFLVNGKEEHLENPPDASGTSFSAWGNSGFGTLVYSIRPENPEETIQLLDKVPMASVAAVYKALYPSNRWRDYHDFDKISLNRDTECWLAPDHKTIVPICYDLARSCALVEAFPGKSLFAVDEYAKRTVKFEVDAQGYLSHLEYFAEKGEFSSVVDSQGNVWVADGEIYCFDPTGKQRQYLPVPERPSTLAITEQNGKTLYFTGRTALYRIVIR